MNDSTTTPQVSRSARRMPAMHIGIGWLIAFAIYALSGDGLSRLLGAVPLAAHELHKEREFLGVVLALLFGARRAFRHPIFSSRYLDWLETTPWWAGQRLPFRNYLLGWPELLAAGLLALATGSTFDVRPWHLPIAMLSGYLIMAFYPLVVTLRIGGMYLFAISLFCVTLAGNHPPLILGILLLHFVAIIRPLRSSVDRLVWKYDIENNGIHPMADVLPLPKRLSRSAAEKQPFPYNLLNRPDCPSIPLKHTLGIAICFGAIAWAIAFQSDETSYAECIAITIIVTTLIAMFRTITYKANCRSPVSLLGRIATRRFIIPGHDRVYIAPLAVLVVGPMCFWSIDRAGMGIPLATGIALSISMIVAMRMGPSLEAWRMTGHYHVAQTTPTRTQARRA